MRHHHFVYVYCKERWKGKMEEWIRFNYYFIRS
jgi:hypothetical protein